MSKISIILADDHPVVRTGIKSLFRCHPDIEIVAEASNGKEALELIEEMCPNILVSDISMPEMTGIELAGKVVEQFPETKIIILTTYRDDEYIAKSFEAGVMSYLPKNCEQSELIEAIHEVYEGRKFVNPMASKALAQTMISNKLAKNKLDKLTDRESQILKMLVEGMRNKKIAEILLISIRTVDTHRTNIMRKLKVNNTAELVKLTLDRNLV